VVGPGTETVAQHNFLGDRNMIRLQTVDQAVHLLAVAVDDQDSRRGASDA
jgi:hypothetical protein